jgi:hypothetical protein
LPARLVERGKQADRAARSVKKRLLVIPISSTPNYMLSWGRRKVNGLRNPPAGSDTG